MACHLRRFTSLDLKLKIKKGLRRASSACVFGGIGQRWVTEDPNEYSLSDDGDKKRSRFLYGMGSK